ncbi:MAG: AraC family transcriptional regulator [Burkholderiales bacterium]|jgi:AraC-like DNA-binding protein|nr:AraC family transcriptional regulator [Burkholderiales bacterium]
MLRASSAMDFQNSPVFPRICVGPARAMYVGPGLQLDPHLNVATTIAVSLDTDFALRTHDPEHGWSAWSSCPVAVIPSQTLHHLRSAGPMAFLYLDPLGDGRAPPGPAMLEDGHRRLRREARTIGIRAAFDGFGLPARRPSDERIARVVREIERRPHEFDSAPEAAGLACLSPSRFRARFADEVGLPFTRYRLWRRMAVVMRTVADGGSLTDGALAAGFASSAHLSTAFRRMFGLSPRALLATGVAIDVSEDAVDVGKQADAGAPGPAGIDRLVKNGDP